ncbi:class V lanthionine synthetase subunit LxmK [Streptomyces sp. MAR4 CNX-425]|uniref:class V lanthionine synthetase subunit LxmK n=1 Tax=Streptomyces sp. MAR4 CNX-425 TaxID=3406343 RepID=UPI003B511696
MVRQRNAPMLDLGTVNTCMKKLGFGAVAPESVRAYPGRRDKCSGITSDGRGVFVKRESPAGLERVRAVEGMHLPGLRRPLLLGTVEEEDIVVYELLEPAVAGDELVRESRFGPECARRVGEALASLHEAPLPQAYDDVSLDPGTLPFPPVEGLEALPVPWFAAASGAVLELWRLIQRDARVCEAVRGLRSRERSALRVPAHCDVRFDQFLFVDGAAYLVDWEEFRLADAARDVGAFLGEWMYHALRTAHRAEPGEERSVGGAADVVAELRRVQPLVASFWLGYLAVRATDDPGLPRRATAFAGWHVLDRLLTDVATLPRLRTAHHTAFGFARTTLVSSGDLAHLMGPEPAGAAHV